MTTGIFEAKAAVIDRLALLAGRAGHILAGVQVAYIYPGVLAKQECIYGGFATFEQPEEEEIADGYDTVTEETALLTLHLQVQAPLTAQVAVAVVGDVPAAGVVRACDVRLGVLLTGVRLGLAGENALPGLLRVARIERGQADYWLAEDMVGSRMSVQVQVVSNISSRA